MFCQEFNSPKEFLTSLTNAEDVGKFLKCSLEMNHVPFTIAAINDLLWRSYPEIAKRELKEASEKGYPLALKLTERKVPTPSKKRTVFENIILSAKNAAERR